MANKLNKSQTNQKVGANNHLFLSDIIAKGPKSLVVPDQSRELDFFPIR